MPFTPFHLGPALFFGFLLLNYLDFPTFVLANVILDIEPLLVLTFNLNFRAHGFFHSFLGGTLVAFLLVAVMSKVREHFSSLLSFFKIDRKTSFLRILIASLSGVYLHILLDARMHQDIQPFYPLDINPFLNCSTVAGFDVYLFCIWCFIGAAIIYGVRLFLLWRKQERECSH